MVAEHSEEQAERRPESSGSGNGANACTSFKYAGEASQSFPGSDVNPLLHPMARTRPGMRGVMKVIR